MRPREVGSTSGDGPNTLVTSESVEGAGNRLVRFRDLSSVLEGLRHCRNAPLTLSEDWSSRRGLVSQIKVQCVCGWFRYITNSYDSEQNKLNTRAMFSMRMIGKGVRSLETFCGMMDLPPPIQGPAVVQCIQRMLEASEDSVQSEILASANQLRASHDNGSPFPHTC